MSTTIETDSRPPFPDHQVFSFMPQLYELITRLRVYKEATQAQSQGSAIVGSNALGVGGAQSSSSRAPTSSPVLTRDAPLTKTISKDSTISNSTEQLLPLDIKDLPEKAYEVRQAIQIAREVVKGLPDIDRSIADQETEIAELEDLLSGLRGRLIKLGGLAADGIDIQHGHSTDVSTDDVVMQGVE